MGAMYRLKAYFGMVPADEMGEYVDGEYEPAFGAGRHDERSVRDGGEGWDDRSERRWTDDERTSYDDEWDRRPARPTRSERGGERVVTTVREHVRATGMAGAGAGGGVGGPTVRGALAIDPESLRDREFSLREAPSRDVAGPVPSIGGNGSVASSVPEQRDQQHARATASPARIVTLHPRSYTEARAIGERFRDGVPVIMNLTELDAASAKRLVDFAAGLVFALRGGFDKVTNRVFLLTPANVEVSADDARMLATSIPGRSVSSTSGAVRVDAERGSFRQD